MQRITHDVLILGTGRAGLRAAVELCIRTRGKVDIGIVLIPTGKPAALSEVKLRLT